MCMNYNFIFIKHNIFYIYLKDVYIFVKNNKIFDMIHALLLIASHLSLIEYMTKRVN